MHGEEDRCADRNYNYEYFDCCNKVNMDVRTSTTLLQIAMVTPGFNSCEHTLNTLRYADRFVYKPIVILLPPAF